MRVQPEAKGSAVTVVMRQEVVPVIVVEASRVVEWEIESADRDRVVRRGRVIFINGIERNVPEARVHLIVVALPAPALACITVVHRVWPHLGANRSGERSRDRFRLIAMISEAEVVERLERPRGRHQERRAEARDVLPGHVVAEANAKVVSAIVDFMERGLSNVILRVVGYLVTTTSDFRNKSTFEIVEGCEPGRSDAAAVRIAVTAVEDLQCRGQSI